MSKVQDIENVKGYKVIEFKFLDEDTNEFVVGYMKKPNTITKLRAMDNAINGLFTACDKIYKSHIIKEESDKRLYDEVEIEKDDRFYLGAVNQVVASIQFAENVLKKN